jgi:hypothetical protein
VIASTLGLPPSVRLADESVVDFALADGRMHHENLEFGIEGLRVRTHGSVGFDESLDLVAELPIPEKLLKRLRLDASLAGRRIQLPVRGTLRRPEIDPAALGASNLGLAIEGLRGLLRERSPQAEGLLDGLVDPALDRLLDGDRRTDRQDDRGPSLFDRLRRRPQRPDDAGP